MVRIAVDTAALAATVAAIRAAADQAEDAISGHSRLVLQISECRDPLLVNAMHRFLGAWGSALHQLIGEARRTADALDLVGQTYGDLDLALSASIAGTAAHGAGVLP